MVVFVEEDSEHGGARMAIVKLGPYHSEDRQTDRQTERQTERQTNKQTNTRSFR